MYKWYVSLSLSLTHAYIYFVIKVMAAATRLLIKPYIFTMDIC